VLAKVSLGALDAGKPKDAEENNKLVENKNKPLIFRILNAFLSHATFVCCIGSITCKGIYEYSKRF